MLIRFIIVFLIVALIEFYFIQALRTISIDYTPIKRKIILGIGYGLALTNVLFVIIAMVYPPPEWNNLFRFISSVLLILAVSKIFSFVILFSEDIIRLIRWVVAKLRTPPNATTEDVSSHISRLKFISYIGVTLTIIPAVSFLYGMVRGAYKYRIHKVKVKSPNLPEAFEGFKIVQISDMHSGSFLTTEPLVKAFNIVMEQKPDAIFFTGDLVNNESRETDMHLDSYKKLKAPYGVYSITGNHDYGDYKQWNTPEEKIQNFEALKNVHAQSGWRLLMNEHVAIEKDGEKIAVLGIENWGGRGWFPKYGKLADAYAGTENYPFKILLSHDPSHWEIQVSQEEQYKDIDLTLSGHTHGMQFGIEIPGLKWSPAKYLYKHWGGLYKQDNQYLYVNRGLGFLGYPGRLGIWPEITVIELSKA